MTGNAAFLAAAVNIGHRLVRDAIWQGESCAWRIIKPYKPAPGARLRPTTAITPGDLYDGTAGIGWFLAELYGQTGDARVARAAGGAIRHALEAAELAGSGGGGFYSGNLGICYAAAQVGTILREEEYLLRASRLLRKELEWHHASGSLDVISGAAGAIPALLVLSNVLGEGEATVKAIELGDYLVRKARREIIGWSWDAPSQFCLMRNQTGLAHGASGIGYSLLELYNITGSKKYRYAAKQAFLYERQFFNRDVLNWPEFRHRFLLEYSYDSGLKSLKTFISDGGKIPADRPSFTNAWCYGAPGIGLTRLRALEILGDDESRTEAELALRTTQKAVWPPRGGFSLCHGLAGNCETLLYGGRVLGSKEYLAVAERCAIYGWQKYGRAGKPWPCGTVDYVQDPGLMIGEAGIGTFYLRLYSSNVTSPLLIVAGPPRKDFRPDPAGEYELRRHHVLTYFARTLSIVDRFSGEDVAGLENDEKCPSELQSDVTRCFDALRARIQQEVDPARRNALDNAFAIDRTRFELASRVTDFTDEFIAGLSRPPISSVRWEEACFRLSPSSALVSCSTIESSNSNRSSDDSTSFDSSDKETFVLHRVGNHIRVRKLNPLAALVLGAFSSPATLMKATSTVAHRIGASASEIPTVERKVMAQIGEAYAAGILELREPHSEREV